jgi:hypothetical protein
MFASPTRLADLPPIKADLARFAAEANQPGPPEVLVVADLLIRNEPGEAIGLYEELMAGIETNEAGKKWSGQIGRLRNEKKTPFKFPHFVGTVTEVAEQLIEARSYWGVNGVLFRLPIWSPQEVLRLAPVFEALEAEGVRRHPKTRDYSW